MLTHNPSRFLASILVLLATMLLSAPEDATAGTYLDSAHGNSTTGVDKTTGFGVGNCAHCHEQHASRGGSEPTPPATSGPSDYMLFADLTGNALCNDCHDGTPAKDINGQIAKAYSHDPLSTTFANSLPGNFPANYQDNGLNCIKCHNSHVAQKPSHAEMTDQNLIKGPLLSVKGVKDEGNWSAAVTPAAGTENLGSTGFPALPITLVDTITKEYELCFACHAGQLDADARLDVAVQFNPNHASVHPVVASAWNNAHLTADPVGAMKAPWNVAGAVNKAMHCSDCHGSETDTDPKGPHGSTNQFMLKLSGPGDSLDNLCNKCHQVLNSSDWVSENVDPGGLPVDKDHDLAAHQYPDNLLGCIACHGGPIGDALVSNIHGANYTWPDEGANPGLISTAFLSGSGSDITKNYSIGTARYCAATCHTGDGGTGYKYAPIP